MNELKIFENEKFGKLRTLMINNEPYFMLKDVCNFLGIKNSRQAKTNLNEDGVISDDVIDSLGRTQQADFINESNLYKLIFQSRKKEAERFTEWVTHDVLPSIRKTGMYATDELLNNPDFLIKALTKLKEERAKNVKLENKLEAYDVALKLRNQQISEMQPKASYYDDILKSDSLISTTIIAKDYGTSAKKFNQMLKDFGIQYNLSGVWLLYSKYQNGGYTRTETYPIPNSDETSIITKWTQKGRLFLYEFLKKKGILPLVERC